MTRSTAMFLLVVITVIAGCGDSDSALLLPVGAPDQSEATSTNAPMRDDGEIPPV